MRHLNAKRYMNRVEHGNTLHHVNAKQYVNEWSFHRVEANIVDIVVSEFELQLFYSVHFRERDGLHNPPS